VKIIVHDAALKTLFKRTSECPGDAKKHVDALSKLSPENTDIILYRGICNYFAGNYEESLTDLETSYQEDPKNINAILYKARAEIELEIYDPAITDLTRLINEKPKLGDAYFWRGFAHYELASRKGKKNPKKTPTQSSRRFQ
jgi:tetratricopeptide (TPR) repeat protein